MDLGTTVGIVFGFAMLLLAIQLSGGLTFFINLPSLMLVVGGTVASTLITFPVGRVLGVMNVVRNAFLTRDQDPNETIENLVQFAEKARREGILSLESAIEEANDDFLKSGIRLAVDGVEPELIKDILDTELAFIEDRHKMGQAIFNTMATYAPAFGMIGTLIGLVAMLQAMEDPSTIGPAMAVALLTTLYGAVMANVVFLPIAGKLKNRTAEEMLIKEITIEGIMSIQSGDNPRIVKQKLQAFLSPKLRTREAEEAA